MEKERENAKKIAVANVETADAKFDLEDFRSKRQSFSRNLKLKSFETDDIGQQIILQEEEIFELKQTE